MAGSRRGRLHLSLPVHREARPCCTGLHGAGRDVVPVLLAVSAEDLPQSLKGPGPPAKRPATTSCRTCPRIISRNCLVSSAPQASPGELARRRCPETERLAW